MVLSDDYQKQAQSADSLHITSEADLLPLSSKQATDDRLSRSSLRGMFAYRKPLVVIGPFDVQTEAMSNVTL